MSGVVLNSLRGVVRGGRQGFVYRVNKSMTWVILLIDYTRCSKRTPDVYTNSKSNHSPEFTYE